MMAWLMSLEWDAIIQIIIIDILLGGDNAVVIALACRNLPGLDMEILRAGHATAARGLRHFKGEGEWVAWRRAAPRG